MKKIMVAFLGYDKGRKVIGNCGSETNAPLPLSMDSIREIENNIKIEMRLKRVVLLNYFQLGEDE